MVLRVKNLSKHFGGIRAVADCTFHIAPNTITALIGPNGAGKTTLFNLVTGYLAPDSGMIHFLDRSIATLRTDEIARSGISRTFQITRVFSQFSVLENLLLAKPHPGERLGVLFFARRHMHACELQYQEECMQLLELVGLAEMCDMPAANLSYGQLKLLEIARVLGSGARLLLFDEPVAGVSPFMRERIKELIFSLRDRGKTILMIEHNMRFVMGICDRVLAMHQGTIIADGAPEEVQRAPQVRESYLGGKLK